MEKTMPKPWTRLLVLVVILLNVVGIADACSPKPILVEFWHVGDDGLSEKLADQVNATFRKSPDFTLSSGKKKGTLVVTIPTNVGWEKVGKRIRVTHRVEFASISDENLGSSAGACHDNELSKCAAQIVKEAKIASRKLH